MEHMKFVGGYPNEDCIYPEDLSMDEKRDTPTIEVTIYWKIILPTHCAMWAPRFEPLTLQFSNEYRL